MALDKWINTDTFIFPNGNKVEFEWENSYSDIKTVIYNGKKVRSFNGVCKAQAFFNKKDELDGIVINNQKTYLRLGGRKCFELIPSLEKDKRERSITLEELKV